MDFGPNNEDDMLDKFTMEQIASDDRDMMDLISDATLGDNAQTSGQNSMGLGLDGTEELLQSDVAGLGEMQWGTGLTDNGAEQQRLHDRIRSMNQGGMNPLAQLLQNSIGMANNRGQPDLAAMASLFQNSGGMDMGHGQANMSGGAQMAALQEKCEHQVSFLPMTITMETRHVTAGVCLTVTGNQTFFVIHCTASTANIVNQILLTHPCARCFL